MLLAERYLRHRYEEGFKVGFEEGFIQGLADARAARFEEGRIQGLAEVRAEIRAEDREYLRRQKRYSARLKAWDARRLKAEAEGEPFDEPLPDFDDDDEADEEDA